MKKLLVLTILSAAIGCSSFDAPPRFESLPPDSAGISFSNDLEYTSGFNIFNYMYFYDGGGVSVGDINNDGLPDLYFTGNMKSNKLYLNRGDFKFEDITDRAGVAGSGDWTTGTTMADVNGDGLLDIYVSNVDYLTKKGRNQLYINNGDTTFTERAEKYGLDFSGYSKQAAFFDYDGDGDLDMFLMNHALHSGASFSGVERKVSAEDAGDRLYRNDGGHFSDVTESSGIKSNILGYGLGIGISDLNRDGCPDIYISNDFHEDDYLYLNNCDSTFTDIMEESVGHTSRASMGNDIADINNDGLADIFVADMLPADEEGLKRSVSSEPYRIYTLQREQGYHPQLIRNTLQVNLGIAPDGNLKFSEIAPFAGVEATDWSWAALLFDMNNSGQKDLFVANGIYRRPNDLDYLSQMGKGSRSGTPKRANAERLKQMPHTKVPNAGFLNRGNFTFAKKSEALGFTDPGYSSGAAYGDLDNDGDLDLVVNNVNSPVTVYRNKTREREEGDFLRIKLNGNRPNTYGVGSKVILYDSASVQLYEMFTTRGFQSSVEPVLTVGVGKTSRIDSLTVVWPDQQVQTIRDVRVGRQLVLNQSDAVNNIVENQSNVTDEEAIFNNATDRIAPDYVHREDPFIDFNRQQLAPFALSSQGPCLTTGDINGDGLEDFFVCGAKGQAGALFQQQPDGTFKKRKQNSLEQDANYEDVDAEFFDADGDGVEDLYVVSGGNQYPRRSKMLSDRLYLNDGTGHLIRVEEGLPPVYENGGTVAVADYDGDGDLDLFTGNRSVPRNYGVTPESHIYENTGAGQFKKVTEEVAPGLKKAGMITDATWSDVNGDGAPDLIVAGEWMPVTIFLNEGDMLREDESNAGLNDALGWWQHLEAGDFDGDGDIDLLAGNMGANSYLKATREEPVVLYLKDFDVDAQVDPILGYTKEGNEYPVAPRDVMLGSLEFLRSDYENYSDYAGETIRDIFGASLTEGSWQKKEVNYTKSALLENKGNGNFDIIPLPEKVQWAPLFASLAGDFKGDGHISFLAGGNLYDMKPSVGGRSDASYGWFLKGRDLNLKVQDFRESGFFVEGEIRAIDQLRLADGQRIIVVARNNDSLEVFLVNKPEQEAS